MKKVKHIDRDKGWRRIRREIAKARRKPHVAVGIFGAKAAADHGGVPNIDVATTHELGLILRHPGVGDGEAYDIPIPERSFIRGTIDARRNQIRKTAKRLGEAILHGRMDTRRALQLLGVFVEGEIKSRISRGIPPPLKQATIDRKGSSTPLINTGQLRASVESQVRNA